jgi:hypothetical protein
LDIERKLGRALVNFWKKTVGSRVSFVSFSLTNDLIRVAIAQYNGNFCGDKLSVFHMQAGSAGQLAITCRYAFK